MIKPKICEAKNVQVWMTVANSCCYRRENPRVWSLCLGRLGLPSFLLDGMFMGRFYRSIKAIWSQVFPTQSYFTHSWLWEQRSEINRILKRKWFLCDVNQGVTILFFQFYKMGHFFYKWHDNNATHCQLSVILMAKIITLLDHRY